MDSEEKAIFIPIGIAAIFAFVLGLALGSVWNDKKHVIHPEKLEELRWQIEMGKIDKLQCEAEKIDSIIRERIRLTGKPNP